MALRLSSYVSDFDAAVAGWNDVLADLEAAGGGQLYLDGHFSFESEPNQLPLVPLKIFGDGPQFSSLSKGTPGAEYRLIAKDSTTQVAYLECRDFRLQGDWDSQLTSAGDGHRLMRVAFYDQILLDGLEAVYSRNMGLSTSWTSHVVIRNCRVLACCRDGITANQSENVLVHNNVVMHCGDDAISVHDNRIAANVRKTAAITNNLLVDALGIKCLGGQEVLIANNTINFPKNRGIEVGRDGSEGQAGNRNYYIVDNVITNITPGALSGLGSVQTAIRVTLSGDPVTNLVIKDNMGGNVLSDGLYSSFKVITDSAVNPSNLLFDKEVGFKDATVNWTGKAYEVKASNAVAQTTHTGNIFANLSEGTVEDV